MDAFVKAAGHPVVDKRCSPSCRTSFAIEPAVDKTMEDIRRKTHGRVVLLQDMGESPTARINNV